jgi:hypothetical protein
MAYADAFVLSNEEQLVQRLAVSLAKTCWYISSEAPETENHDLRMALVNHAGPRNADYLSFARECTVYLLAQNATISVNSSDGDLDTALAGIWNGYAERALGRGLITVAA